MLALECLFQSAVQQNKRERLFLPNFTLISAAVWNYDPLIHEHYEIFEYCRLMDIPLCNCAAWNA